MNRFLAALTFGSIVTAAPVMAQQQSAKDTSRKEIPSEARPPKGMCRIWIDNVPAAQQPAPTDCPTAVKNKPANGRVIFGDDYAAPDKKDPKALPPVKGFTGVKGGKPPVIIKP